MNEPVNSVVLDHGNGERTFLAHFTPGSIVVSKGRKVKEGIVATLVPATMKSWKRLLKEGHINTLIDAGFVISNPGCGGCASGQIGMTGEGQVHISTSNRNFAGKQGAGLTHLASPETAAASAILGRIATKEELE